MSYLLKKINCQLLLILFLAGLVRFGGLNWCSPYTPHPDEWNMATAVTKLSWEDKLNPDFFAYGQFPLYLTYFSARIYNLIPWIAVKEIDIQEAIFFLRFWSAIVGVGTVYLAYLISKKLTPTTHPRHFDFAQCKLTTHNSQLTPLLASLLSAFTPGLTQMSHFGTTESFLSFFFLLITFLSFKITENPRLKYFVFLGIALGLALGTKISALVFAVPILLSYIINLKKNFAGANPDSQRDAFILTTKYFFTLCLCLAFTLISSPYLVLSFTESKRILLYETAVATGKSPVFYTRQFINTLPILFQLQKIFPFVLGWPIFILGSGGFFLTIFLLIKNILKKRKHSLTAYYLLLTTPFVVYFLSQAFLFCKWTRFMAPIFAFFPIFAIVLLNYLSRLRYLGYLLIFLSILPGIIFSSIYFQPDIRFTASDWIYQNIPFGSKILFDTGNVVDIPISRSKHQSLITNYSLISFDFYHLDENAELFPKLTNYLITSDYIFVPSRRIFANYLRLAGEYPLTAKYYSLLFSGKLGFTEIKTFTALNSKLFADEKAEETFTVFDHPTIRIYKKVVGLGQKDYENLLQE